MYFSPSQRSTINAGGLNAVLQLLGEYQAADEPVKLSNDGAATLYEGIDALVEYLHHTRSEIVPRTPSFRFGQRLYDTVIGELEATMQRIDPEPAAGRSDRIARARERTQRLADPTLANVPVGLSEGEDEAFNAMLLDAYHGLIAIGPNRYATPLLRAIAFLNGFASTQSDGLVSFIGRGPTRDLDAEIVSRAARISELEPDERNVRLAEEELTPLARGVAIIAGSFERDERREVTARALEAGIERRDRAARHGRSGTDRQWELYRGAGYELGLSQLPVERRAEFKTTLGKVLGFFGGYGP